MIEPVIEDNMWTCDPLTVGGISAIAVAGSRLFVATEGKDSTIHVVDANSLQTLYTFAGEGDSKLDHIRSVTVSADEVYVLDGPAPICKVGARISAFSHSGQFLRYVKQPDDFLFQDQLDDILNAPAGLLDSLRYDDIAYGHGHLYALQHDGILRVMTVEGAVLQSIQLAGPGTGSGNAGQMAVQANRLYVTRENHNEVDALIAGPDDRSLAPPM